jgi:hypothetical protein
MKVTRLQLEALGNPNLPPVELDDTLTDFDQRIVGRDLKLSMPMHSQVRLRDLADILHGLANQLDNISRDTTLKPRHALFDAGTHVRAAQRKINDVFKLRERQKSKNRKAGRGE